MAAARPHARNWGDVDDGRRVAGRVARARGQLRDKGDRHEVLGGDVGLECLGPALGRGPAEMGVDAVGVGEVGDRAGRLVLGHARAVDEQMDALRLPLGHPRCEMVDGVGRHQIGGDGHAVAAAPGRRRLQHLLVPLGDVHRCAVSVEGLGDHLAGAGAAAGDDALKIGDREELGGEKVVAGHSEKEF